MINVKCHKEVELVLYENFAEIVKKHCVIIPRLGGWPSAYNFDIVERAVTGLHVFTVAILRDIEYLDSPVCRLNSLIPFLKYVAGAGPMRSIEVMDLFYTCIFSNVPESDLQTTLKVLGALITMPDPSDLFAQGLCNFLCLDPNNFSSAL